jgi:hypothetical protein
MILYAFFPKGVILTSIKSDKLIFKGCRCSNLYLVDFSSNNASLSVLICLSSHPWDEYGIEVLLI